MYFRGFLTLSIGFRLVHVYYNTCLEYGFGAYSAVTIRRTPPQKKNSMGNYLGFRIVGVFVSGVVSM